MTYAIAWHYGAATHAAFAPVPSSYPATASRRAAARSTSAGDQQGEQAADDRSGHESKAHGEDPGKDRSLKGRIETACDSMGDGMRERVGLTLARHRLGLGAVIVQRNKEAKEPSGQGTATKYELAQAPSNGSALSMTRGHRIVIGNSFGLLNLTA